MNANTFITVYTVTDANKAELIKVELQTEGMPCRLDGENQAGFSQVFQIGIMVLAKDDLRPRIDRRGVHRTRYEVRLYAARRSNDVINPS